MKDSILKYILIVSLLMNFSLLGTAAYTHYKQARYPLAPLTGHTGMGAKLGPFGHGAQGGHLFEELSLRPEQEKLFRQKAAAFHQGLGKKRQEVDTLKASLVALMRADSPDARAIDAAIVQIDTAQQEMQKSVVSHMLDFKSMLDKEQRKKFFDLIQGAMDLRNDGVCP